MRQVFSLLLVLIALSTNGQPGAGPTRAPHQQGPEADGELTGRVVSAAGPAIEGATVALRGTALGCATGASGTFRLRAPAGRYHLVVSSIGYAPREQDVQVAAGQATAWGPWPWP